MNHSAHEHQPRRLLIVTTLPLTLHSFLLPYAAHFRGKGWQVDAMAQGATDCKICAEHFDHVWDVTWSRNPLNPSNLRLAPKQIQQVVRQEQYDLVHVHTPVASFITRYALRRFRQTTKVIYTAHGFHFYRGGSPYKNLLFFLLEKLAGQWTDYLIVINHEDMKAAQDHRIVPGNRLRYMPGIGIDTACYSPEAIPTEAIQRIGRELNLLPDNQLFLMIAEFNPGKGHKDALAALRLLSCPNAHLAFAGVGRLLEETKRLAAAAGVQDRVHFLGFRQDIPALITSSVATVLPSVREGLPRSIMESLSLGVPVIGTNIRGIRDLIENGAGLLVEVGDTKGLAHAMAWILDHPQQSRGMGDRGKVQMRDYDVQNVIALHEELYAKALAD